MLDLITNIYEISYLLNLTQEARVELQEVGRKEGPDRIYGTNQREWGRS